MTVDVDEAHDAVERLHADVAQPNHDRSRKPRVDRIGRGRLQPQWRESSGPGSTSLAGWIARVALSTRRSMPVRTTKDRLH
jgi:hypothetical protein